MGLYRCSPGVLHVEAVWFKKVEMPIVVAWLPTFSLYFSKLDFSVAFKPHHDVLSELILLPTSQTKKK